MFFRSPRPALTDNVRSALFMLLSMAGFVVNDTMVKLASAQMSTPQIMGIRGLMATIILFTLAHWRGVLPSRSIALHPMVILRTAADILATLTYITALAQMPIANASAIFQALPLVVTLGAALVFGERVGWRRWSAIAVGFVGVMIIVRPGGDGFTVYSFAVLAAVLCSAVRDLATRRMPAGIASLTVAALTALAVGITGFLLVPFSHWAPVEARHLGFLGFASLAIMVGYIFIVNAMRSGEMGFVAPFRYSILVYAIVIGLLVFGEIPPSQVLIGAAIVVGSGVYTLYRERRLAQLGRAPVAPIPTAAPGL